MKYQAPNEIVKIADWEYDPDHPFYPEGSRVKSLLFSPDKAPFDFIKEKHAYLFKQSRERYPTQFWAEVIAYRVGCLMGVEVPPAFVAFDSEANQFAALIEWFYVYPFSSTDQNLYISGGEYMKRLIPEYDQKKGKQHNVQTFVRFMNTVIKPVGETAFDPLLDLARIFIFDSLIGNTDRHQDNWGIVWKIKNEEIYEARLSPAFDNGTSLGHEILDSKLENFLDLERLNSYVKRGRHHIRWTLKSPNQCGHLELIELFVEKFPQYIVPMIDCLNFNHEKLKSQIFELSEFSVNDNLSIERCEFVVNMILKRRDLLLDILSN